MDTFVRDYISELDQRWGEVDILIEQAEKCIEENLLLYNALCRSISILMVSHMEGFMKDITRNVIQDINNNLDFHQIPHSIKRTFCIGYLGSENSSAHRIENMIADFSEYKDVKLKPEHFLVKDNKNPKPQLIKDILAGFGISDIFQNLHSSFFDNTFESSQKASRNLNRLKNIINIVTSKFPYDGSINRFNLNKEKYRNRTLWQEFLDNLNQNRHKIVHGNMFDNIDSINEIKLRLDKVKILQLLVVYVLCSKVAESLVNESE
ncbi:hypothetical protein HYD28_13880 [Pseudoalteromonas shioyasakiensis]|nr:hypothetical protein HYD28_13880 [Pseudoalteromonas shioyasakiensis]